MKLIILNQLFLAIHLALAFHSQNGPIKAYVVFNVGDSAVTGTLTLSQKDPASVVWYQGTLSNLTPNTEHGFHVHTFGNIAGGCKSAGEHFNPRTQNHGAPWDFVRHVGDLGNIQSDANGNVNLNRYDHLISLSGPDSIIGRAFVIHEKVDDLGRGGNEGSITTGNSGSRLRCGTVVLA